jgi:hypothetical protein
MATLAEIRAKLRDQENKGSNNNSSYADNAVYPFWNIKEGESATLRFLPDGDTKNDFFWVERAMIKLQFSGVKGDTDSKPVMVQVPCVEMYNKGMTCPILSEVRPWFKDPSLEDLGRKYWKKKSYLFQGFVRENPLDEESPENPIRRFIIGPQIFQIIKASILDPDLEEMPTDYTSGLDFRLNKTSKGGYADYGTSKWARKETPLGDADMHAVNTHGLFNLSDFLPKVPTDVELKIIHEMFEASVDGDVYDAERWGQYYRPSGMSIGTGDPVAPTTPAATTKLTARKTKPPVDDVDDEIPFNNEKASAPVKEDAAPAASTNAQDILSMIRARQNQ